MHCCSFFPINLGLFHLSLSKSSRLWILKTIRQNNSSFELLPTPFVTPLGLQDTAVLFGLIVYSSWLVKAFAEDCELTFLEYIVHYAHEWDIWCHLQLLLKLLCQGTTPICQLKETYFIISSSGSREKNNTTKSTCYSWGCIKTPL